ncbi:winged helix-turn-helix domain-containing protein [Marinobacter sp. NFXS11]|uniref:winged helix-turn-helix domain-containing protein n=1 Tax=Marinobacter sp. NFXS11 TaxID=2818432 RepID=UPI0032DEFEA8
MIFSFSDFQLDTHQLQLRRAGTAQPLEPLVFDLLTYLLTHRDRIVSRAELLDQLWSGKVVSDSAVSSAIKAVRKALGDDGKTQGFIATFNRRGYRFVANMDASELLAQTSGPDFMEQSAAEAHQELAAACLFSSRNEREKEQPVLVVLPFAHAVGVDQIAWIAEVLCEDISIHLARIPGFFVLSRNTTFQYRHREVSIQQIARELDVDYVIEGSVWPKGDNLRVGVQLLDAASGNMLWSDRKLIPAESLNALEEEVVREIVSRIEPQLNRAELIQLRKRRTVDLGAWALYRQGHAILGQKGWSEDSFTEAANFLRQAIQRDPELAFAHAYLALIIAIGHLVGLIRGHEWLIEAAQSAEKAVALDGQDTDVLGYAGCAFADMGDLQRGVGMLRRAVELDPSNAQAIAALGAAMIRQGEVQGIDFMLRGMKISPRDNRRSAWGALLARGMLNFGQIDDAIRTASDACRCDDRIFLPRVVLAIAHIHEGNIPRAVDALSDARRIRPSLGQRDIARFASRAEMALLQKCGLLAGLSS